MADNYDSFSFDHYELIPRDETLKRPVADKYAFMNSKPYFEKSEKTEDNKSQPERENNQKLHQQKDNSIQLLKKQIQQLAHLLDVEKNINKNFQKIFQELKRIVNKPDISNQQVIIQIDLLLKQKKEVIYLQPTKISQYLSQLKLFEQTIRKKQQQIRELKSKLLQSTSNNINNIFQTQLSESQCILHQIMDLKEDFNKINFKAVRSKNQCYHQEKIGNLIRKYQEMLDLYHKNEKLMYQLKNRQQQNFTYFSSLRVQLSSQIHQVCSGYTDNKIFQLEKQIKSLSQNFKSGPEKVKTEGNQSIKFKQLAYQVQKLKERIIQRQLQIQKMKEANNQLLMKTKTSQKCEKQLNKMKQLYQKLRKKDERIQQLQTTIIEHIDSKVRSDTSITSQQEDVEKLRNNIRNLKTVILNLKQENRQTKQKIKELSKANKDMKKALQNVSNGCDRSQYVEKVSRDQGSFRVIQGIIGVLLNLNGNQGHSRCQCLQKTTDCLINLNEQYPELQQILQGLGVMQKTTNLLPVQD